MTLEEIQQRARQRSFLAYLLHDKGKTYKEIGIYLKVSPERVRQLVNKAIYRKKLHIIKLGFRLSKIK